MMTDVKKIRGGLGLPPAIKYMRHARVELAPDGKAPNRILQFST
jgi:hypothetical protein